jgi:hypothetical protein
MDALLFDVILHNLRQRDTYKLIFIWCRIICQSQNLNSECNNYSYDQEIDLLRKSNLHCHNQNLAYFIACSVSSINLIPLPIIVVHIF